MNDHNIKMTYLGATNFAHGVKVGTDFQWGFSDATHKGSGVLVYSVRVMAHYISHLARLAFEDLKQGRGEETAIVAAQGFIFAKDKAGLKHWYTLLTSATRVQPDLDIKWEFGNEDSDLAQAYPERIGLEFANETSTQQGREIKFHRYEVSTVDAKRFAKDFAIVVPALIKKDFGNHGLKVMGTSVQAMVGAIPSTEIVSAYERINSVLIKRKEAIDSIKEPWVAKEEDYSEFDPDDDESLDDLSGPSEADLEAEERGEFNECKANIILDENGVPVATKKWIQDFRAKKEKEEAVKMAGISPSKTIPAAQGVKPSAGAPANKPGVSDRWEFSVGKENRRLSECYTYMDILLFREGDWTVTINPIGTSGWIVRENIMQNPAFPWRMVGNYLQVATPDDMKDKELDSAVKKLAETLQRGGKVSVLEDET